MAIGLSYLNLLAPVIFCFIIVIIFFFLKPILIEKETIQQHLLVYFDRLLLAQTKKKDLHNGHLVSLDLLCI